MPCFSTGIPVINDAIVGSRNAGFTAVADQVTAPSLINRLRVGIVPPFREFWQKTSRTEKITYSVGAIETGNSAVADTEAATLLWASPQRRNNDTTRIRIDHPRSRLTDIRTISPFHSKRTSTLSWRFPPRQARQGLPIQSIRIHAGETSPGRMVNIGAMLISALGCQRIKPWLVSAVQEVRAMSPISSHAATQLTFPHLQLRSLRLIALFVMWSVWPSVALAEVRVVTAQGEHRMGDRDTREDAIRLATETAKRNALEQVAVYLESVTIVDGLDVTKDEVRTYTAGLVLVLEQETNTTLDGDTIVVRTDLVAQIDTEEVKQAIAALRENEDARHQLVSLQQENDQLQQDLDAANQALAQASTAEQTQQAAQQRQDILNRVKSNSMVSQAWTDWILVSPAVYPTAWIGFA